MLPPRHPIALIFSTVGGYRSIKTFDPTVIRISNSLPSMGLQAFSQVIDGYDFISHYLISPFAFSLQIATE